MMNREGSMGFAKSDEVDRIAVPNNKRRNMKTIKSSCLW